MCNNNPCNCKKIDWSRPIRIINPELREQDKRTNYRVERINDGMEYIVRHTYMEGTTQAREYTTLWTRDGVCLSHTWSKKHRIENILEEPSNVVVLVKDNVSDCLQWSIHTRARYSGRPLFTESEAQKYAAEQRANGYQVHMTTLPVTKD